MCSYGQMSSYGDYQGIFNAKQVPFHDKRRMHGPNKTACPMGGTK